MIGPLHRCGRPRARAWQHMRAHIRARTLTGAFSYTGLALLLVTLAGCKQDAFCVNCDEGDPPDGSKPIGQDPLGDGGTNSRIDSGIRLPDGGLDLRDGSILTPCTPRMGGELCNGIDDDCDDRVDEDFDLQSDPEHCGACNKPCVGENAEATCSEGACEIGDCLDGFSDLDDDGTCEYRCPVFPARDEDCNGTDDDCDGEADEELGAPPTDLCRTTPGTPCEDTEAVCKTVEGVTTWYCEYPDGVEFDPIVPNGIALEETRCDGHDGDCDGSADDPWPVGDTCDDGGVGICRDVGALACKPDDDTAVFCDLSVAPDAQTATDEACNLLDDDCDGTVDEEIVDDMVHITGGDGFYIFRYEASQQDATADERGNADGRACSKPNVLPWTFVTFAQASDACAAAGKRLCSGDEWAAACGAQTYPYGPDYQANRCNGADNAAGAMLPTGSADDCETSDGIFDLSGNVKEWTNDPPPMTTDIYVVRGGSFESPKLGLTCDTTLSQAASTAGQAAIGFRCCSDDPP